MMKKFFNRFLSLTLIVSTLGILVLIFFSYKLFFQGPVPSGYPLPYIYSPGLYEEQGVLEKDVDILIIGDRYGKYFSLYEKFWLKGLKKQLGRDLKVLNLATEKESLARTLKKIKSLDELPPITLYMGSSEEFYEQRASLKFIKQINRNIKRYKEKPAYSFLSTQEPWLSKFIYRYVKPIEIGKKINEMPIGSLQNEYLQYREIVYDLFNYEFAELIRNIGQKNSELIVFTSPFESEVAVKRNCLEGIDLELDIKLKKIQQAIEQGSLKSALNDLNSLEELAKGNPHFYFAKAQALKQTGNLQKAYAEFEKAKALDCRNLGASPIFNNIIRKHALRWGLAIVDFELILRASFGDEAQFTEDGFPQNPYYQRAIYLLNKRILEFKAALI